MKTIIAIWGVANTGKTAAIRKTYEEFISIKHGAIIQSYLEDNGDIVAEIIHGSKKIGIISVGDPNSSQGQRLLEAAIAGCDIIICACRTRGQTVHNIYNTANTYGYEIIWTSHYSLESGNRGQIRYPSPLPNGNTHLDLNELFATAIIELINQLL